MGHSVFNCVMYRNMTLKYTYFDVVQTPLVEILQSYNAEHEKQNQKILCLQGTQKAWLLQKNCAMLQLILEMLTSAHHFTSLYFNSRLTAHCDTGQVQVPDLTWGRMDIHTNKQKRHGGSRNKKSADELYQNIYIYTM